MRRIVHNCRKWQRFGSRDIAFAANAFQQIAFGNTGGREDDVIAARQSAEHNALPLDAHRFAACQLLLANATILFVVAFDVMTRQQTTVHVAI